MQLAGGVLFLGRLDGSKRPHGEGELLLADGSMHAGSFDGGAASGEGAYYDRKGAVHRGRWEANKRAGEFAVVNQHLLRDLMARGLWTDEIRNQIIAHNGSVQSIPEVPDDLKAIDRTCWEMKMRSLIDMAADRGAFIDQSQSFNVFMTDPNYAKLSSMHFYGWKKGLKTGMYYLRSKV